MPVWACGVLLACLHVCAYLRPVDSMHTTRVACIHTTLASSYYYDVKNYLHVNLKVHTNDAYELLGASSL